MRHRLWFWWSLAGAAATVGYHLLPRDSLIAGLFYNAIGLCSALMIIVGVRRYRPRNPGMWYLFAAGQTLSVVGDLVWQYYVFVLHQEPYPSGADIFYLASYLPLILGLLQFVRSRTRTDLATLIDAAVIAAGLGLVFWIFVLHPVAVAGATSGLEQVTSIAYPAADALLLAMLTRLFIGTSAGARTASTRLLGAAAFLLFAADASFSVLTLHSDSDGYELSAGWLLSYVLWAAAALHPGIAAETPQAAATTRVGRGPLLLAFVCSLLAPAMLFLPQAGANTADRIAIAAAATLLCVLSFVRSSGLMGQVQRQTDRLEHLAMHDDLTGLANRRHFEDALRRLPPGAGPEVVFLGLTGFKNVNDELGRPVGDQALRIVAARIRLAAAPEVLIARMGGDEFALLLTGGEAAEPVALRLAEVLRAPVPAGGHELLVGAGIGIGATGRLEAPHLEAPHLEALRRAEVAMYAAKATGEPYRRWSSALDDGAGEQARLGAELRTALDTGQLRVVYQPIVAFPEGRVVAAEALVRWEHPERGPISPAYFIPVAERNGLIVELGAWVLSTACAQMAEWRGRLGAKAPDRISVNVSARQLTRADFPQTVAAALAAAGLPPACLALEVTETAVFDGGRAVQALHRLRALGVRIALDDFGTGHSSLRLLQTVPADILKVDKSFVDDIAGTGRHRAIAEALIHISDGLGLTAVAEGVETAEQADALHHLGYRLLQGYHFGRPVTGADLQRRLGAVEQTTGA